MLSTLWGETTLVTSGDMFNTNFGPDNINKPQAYYMENVMPTSAGYQSVGWNLIAPAVGPTNLQFFNDIFELKVPNTSTPGPTVPTYLTVYIATTYAAVGIWVLDEAVGPNWVFKAPPYSSTIFPLQVSTAFIDGQTYIFMAGKGCFHYDFATSAFIADALVGVTATNLLGITSANGYMIAYAANGTVLWSSLVNPLDFTPSLITGAGGGSISEIKAQLIGCYTISGGFIIYSYDNAVQASYTGNVQFPFKFQEVPGSGGITSPSSVTWQDNSDTHIIYGTKGLQTITIGSNASQLFPEVTEMLTAGYIETFSLTTLTFTQTPTFIPFNIVVNPLINMIGTRYVVISYNPILTASAGGFYLNYSHALVYDRTLNRWGKIVKDHVDVIEIEDITQAGNVIIEVRNIIGFVDHLGKFENITLDFTISGNELGKGNSLILFGKFQLQRNRGVYLQRAKFENLITGQTWSTYVLPTYDGNTFAPAVQLSDLGALNADEADGTNVKTFGGRVYGKNVSILLIGNFNLSSAQVDLVIGADD